MKNIIIKIKEIKDSCLVNEMGYGFKIEKVFIMGVVIPKTEECLCLK